jgi:hypothetical protein
MTENLTLPASGRTPERLRSPDFPASNGDILALYGKTLDSLERDALRLASRKTLTFQLFTGSRIPAPPAETAAEILARLEMWITKHANHTETSVVSLDMLPELSGASKLLQGLWPWIQSFYRFHL